jgi:hypothetical protein
LSILKPAGSVGVTVQLAIAPPELLKVMLVMAKPIIAIWSAPVAFVRLGAGAFTVDQIATTDSAITDITFSNSGGAIASCTVAPTLYTLRALTSVGTPLMVQVALSILKPAGSVGVTVQLAIAPPELPKVMLVMAKPIIAILQMQQVQTK